MKRTVTFELDTEEGYIENEMFMRLAYLQDIWIARDDILQFIRSRIKYGEKISDEEEKSLKAIQEMLLLEPPW